MIGAIIGDIVGSVYEFDNILSTEFEFYSPKAFFTDDTVLTIAVADAMMNKKDYSKAIKQYARNYPGRGYGGRFAMWIKSESYEPYNSFGNGSAMRVSPVGFAFNTLEETLAEAKKTAEVTHNHPEGIKGAQAIAAAMFLARNGSSIPEIKKYIQTNFSYPLTKTIDEIRLTNQFDETCQGSVPEAITAFLESKNYEHSIRLAVSIGGDTDTIACITGGIAQAFYKNIPKEIIAGAYKYLPEEYIEIIEKFNKTYNINY